MIVPSSRLLWAALVLAAIAAGVSIFPEYQAPWTAIGVGFADGWFGDLVEKWAHSRFGDGTSAADLMDRLSQQSGLDLPGDAETLAVESAALAVGDDFAPDASLGSPDGSGFPVGVKVQGDPDEIESVLDKLRPRLGPVDSFLDSDRDGDLIAIGPDAGYRSRLLEDGDLGSSEVFENVVREASDAAAVLFVNFNVGNDWLTEVDGDDPELAENVEPLQGLGLSTWRDDASHLVLRVTTD